MAEEEAALEEVDPDVWAGEREDAPFAALEVGVGANDGTIVCGEVATTEEHASSLLLDLLDLNDDDHDVIAGHRPRHTMRCYLTDEPRSAPATRFLRSGAVISVRDPLLRNISDSHLAIVVNAFQDICIDHFPSDDTPQRQWDDALRLHPSHAHHAHDECN